MHCRIEHSVFGLILAFSSWATSALAQDESRLSLDLGVGIDISVNGTVNSGAIGRLSGQLLLLPNLYGQVYGTGLHFLVGAGWALNDESELRGAFTFQTGDANLVRLGDLGPSSCTDNIRITKPSVSTWATGDTPGFPIRACVCMRKPRSGSPSSMPSTSSWRHPRAT